MHKEHCPFFLLNFLNLAIFSLVKYDIAFSISPDKINLLSFFDRLSTIFSNSSFNILPTDGTHFQAQVYTFPIISINKYGLSILVFLFIQLEIAFSSLDKSLAFPSGNALSCTKYLIIGV